MSEYIHGMEHGVSDDEDLAGPSGDIHYAVDRAEEELDERSAARNEDAAYQACRVADAVASAAARWASEDVERAIAGACEVVSDDADEIRQAWAVADAASKRAWDRAKEARAAAHKLHEAWLVAFNALPPLKDAQ